MEENNIVVLIRTSICLPELFSWGIDREWEIPLSRIMSISAGELASEMLNGDSDKPIAKEMLETYLSKLQSLSC